jgi:CRP-like cAMP-binding protein
MNFLLAQNVLRTIQHQLNPKEYELLSASFYPKSYDKKTILTEPGKLCKQVYFITKGSAYSYFLDEQGEKHVIQFAIEGYWITDHYSFFSGRQGIYTVESLEEVDALVMTREAFEHLCHQSHVFEHFFRVLVQNAFVSLQYRLAKTNSAEAMQRYLEFSKNYPDFIQRIPQYLIASYLGIKPQSLSRIRKELALD